MKKIFTFLLGALVFTCCHAEEVAPLHDSAAASDCTCESDSPLPTPICAVYVKLIAPDTKLSGKKVYNTSCAFSCDSAYIIKRLSPYACEETSPYPWIPHEPNESEVSIHKLRNHFPVEQLLDEPVDAVPIRKIRSIGIPEWKLPLIKRSMELHANPMLRATGTSTTPSWLQWKPPFVQAALGVGLGVGVGKSGLYNSEIGHPLGHGYHHHERIPSEQWTAVNHQAIAPPVQADEPVTASAIPVWDLPEVVKE